VTGETGEQSALFSSDDRSPVRIARIVTHQIVIFP
jgi:hypothetical protein